VKVVEEILQPEAAAAPVAQPLPEPPGSLCYEDPRLVAPLPAAEQVSGWRTAYR